MFTRWLPAALALLLVTTPGVAGLQKNGIEFGVYVPFNFPSNSVTEEFFPMDLFPGNVTVGEAAGVGVLVGWTINQNIGLELSYERSRIKTDSLELDDSAFGAGVLPRTEGFLDALFLSGNVSYPVTETITPYLLVSGGILRTEFEEVEYEVRTEANLLEPRDVLSRSHTAEFGWAVGAGSRFFLNDNVDFRVQVRSLFEGGDYRNTAFSVGLGVHWNRQ